MNDPNAIWTPDGLVDLANAKPRARVELRPALMEWFRQFADFAEWQSVGLHCSRCKADIVGKNNDADKSFAVACQCREWVGGNRDWKPPVIQ